RLLVDAPRLSLRGHGVVVNHITLGNVDGLHAARLALGNTCDAHSGLLERVLCGGVDILALEAQAQPARLTILPSYEMGDQACAAGFPAIQVGADDLIAIGQPGHLPGFDIAGRFAIDQVLIATPAYQLFFRVDGVQDAH